MTIKNNIEKLIGEYVSKIQDCDKVIHTLEESKRFYRKRNCIDDLNQTHLELKVLLAQRQAYFQAKIDIDSLLDFI